MANISYKLCFCDPDTIDTSDPNQSSKCHKITEYYTFLIFGIFISLAGDRVNKTSMILWKLMHDCRKIFKTYLSITLVLKNRTRIYLNF